jgi:hypothetical protein
MFSKINQIINNQSGYTNINLENGVNKAATSCTVKSCSAPTAKNECVIC